MFKTYVLGLWQPKFMTEDGKISPVVAYQFVNGLPDCETTQWRAIYYVKNSEDE